MTGGDDGFDAFFRDGYPRLVRQLLAVTGNLADAEEAVQEAYLRASTRWGRVRHLDAPEAWVRRVALNLATDEFRRTRRRLAAWLRAAPRGHVDPPSEELPDLVRALAALPPGHRQVLVLHYLVGLAPAEVAAELRLSTAAVHARLSRGRKALAATLGEVSHHE